jgi:hypothetical protein
LTNGNDRAAPLLILNSPKYDIHDINLLEPYLGVGGFDHVYMLGLSYRFGLKETTYMATE